MGTLGVAVAEIVANDSGEVRAVIPDQGPVEALTADRANETLGVGVRRGRSDRRQDHADRFVAKTVSKALVCFPSRSPMRNENRSSSPARARFRAWWTTQPPLGCG